METAVVTKQDPGENAYNRIKGLERKFIKKDKGAEGISAESTANSRLIHEWKLAQRYGDVASEKRLDAEIERLEISYKSIAASLRRSAPMGGLSREMRARFEDTLTAADKDDLKTAEDWYDKMFYGEKTQGALQ